MLSLEYRPFSQGSRGLVLDMLSRSYHPLLADLPDEKVEDLLSEWRAYDDAVFDEPDSVGDCGFFISSAANEPGSRHLQVPEIKDWKRERAMSDFKAAPVKPAISIDDLAKIDVRVGTIERVDDIERSDKLVKLTVNFGDHTRSILAGVKKERENPAELEGAQALFVINLEPRKMMGELSEGMLFDIGYADDITPALAVPEKSIPKGARLG